MARRHRADRQPWWKIILNVLGGIVLFVLALYCFSGIINACVNSTRNKYATSFSAAEYENQLTPEFKDGYYVFKTDGDFKIVQLTDVHIGGGYWSAGRDKKALTAVATMISAEKPDLVVVTGDLAYPVPFQTGTLNNKAAAKTFAKLMEKLGVYWTIGFGNHDTEAYSYFNRKEICEFYASIDKRGNRLYPHCLMNDMGGDDVAGYGNQIIKVQNSAGIVTHAVVILDSHAYLADDPWGVKWGYDYIKDNQIAWYENEIKKIDAANKAVDPACAMFTSTAYFHIPLMEMRDAYKTLKENNVKTFENPGETLSLTTAEGDSVTYFEGTFGEDPAKEMVYSSETRVALFKKMVELGSTKAVFNGHDHLNNVRVTVGGIDLVYGMSIDYLAYGKIKNYGRQRGCTVISVENATGNVSVALKNYYNDYDAPEKEKAKMNMGDYYA